MWPLLTGQVPPVASNPGTGIAFIGEVMGYRGRVKHRKVPFSPWNE